MKTVRMLIRLARERNWKFFRFVAKKTLRGMTHWRCLQCGAWTGPTTSTRCNECGMLNLFMALQMHEDEEES